VHGIGFIDNDAVNLSCTILGGGVAWLITTPFI
jgi:uncharacterized membrane protein